MNSSWSGGSKFPLLLSGPLPYVQMCQVSASLNISFMYFIIFIMMHSVHFYVALTNIF